MLRIIATLAVLLISSVALAGNSSLPNLNAGSAVSGTDLFYDVQTAGVGGVKVTAQQIYNFMVNNPTSLVKPTTDGQNALFQNGSKTAYTNIYGPAAPVGLFDYDNIRSVIDVEPGTLVQNYNAYGAWIWNNTPDTSTCGGLACPAAVGYEAYCVNAVANANCFGFNPAVTDTYDGTAGHSVASTIVGMEVDITTGNAATTATGISLVIQGPTQAGADVVQALITAGTTARWTNGFALNDGAIGTGGAGLILGTLQVSSGTSISSSTAIFNIFDTVGTEHHIILQGTPNGTASQLVLSDANAVSGLAFKLAASGTAAQVAASGSPTNISLQLTAKGTTGGVALNANSSNMFDCNITNSGYCTLLATNGLALNNLPVAQGNNIVSNSVSGYELNTGNASATAPTFSPNLTDLKAGIGADTAGDVSIIADNAGTATEIIRATGTGPKLFGGGSAMFDCNLTFSGYCTVTSTNGLAMNGLGIIQINVLDANNASGFRINSGAASATAPTLIPNKADLKAGIGADISGDVSIIADNAGTATEIARITGTSFSVNTTINTTTGYKANGTSGVASQTCTVNQAKTLVFTFGILTGGTCNT